MKDKKHSVLIFVESIIYIIMITLFVFLNTYGTIYFRIIPLLFILGVLGKIIFDRPVFTTIYSICVSVLVIFIQGEYTFLQNILSSIYVGFNVAIGEILGRVLEELYNDYKREKISRKLKNFHLIVHYISAAIFIVVPLGLNIYINSDICTYLNKKDVLSQYINEKYYSIKSFTITDARYSFAKDTFDFKIKENLSGSIYNFTVFADNMIKDGYIENTLNNKNYVSNLLLRSYVMKYTDVNIYIEYDYSSDVYLKIEKNVGEITDEKLLDFSKLVEQILNDVKKYNYYDDINKLDLKVTTETLDLRQTVIRKDNFDKDYQYFFDSLKVEYLDEN